MARLCSSAARFFLLVVFSLTWSSRAAVPPPPTELHRGFRATPDLSASDFQPVLVDSSGNFSLGFLRVGRTHLRLSVLHVPSSIPLWSAETTPLARWKNPTELFFNGSLVLSDPANGIFWSTHTVGDRVWLSNTSNLEIQIHDGVSTIWQSFDNPSDTLVENQNFTNNMTLTSSNGLYYMRLGQDFFGLYAKFTNSDKIPDQMYFRHSALQVKAEIIQGQPVQLILQPEGYLGMYQNISLPADLQPFDTFQQKLSGFRLVRIEPDGNLKAYYWTGSNWIVDYQAITDPCELPSACGSYGLCKPGKECSCLNKQTAHQSGGCAPAEIRISGDFCGPYESRLEVLRRSGVELPFKELMEYKKMSSYEDCESTCAGNCTCWGAVYSNYSGFCYTLAFPVQTLLAVGEEGKMGYFKVREGIGRKKRAGVGLGVGLLVGVILVFGGIAGVGWYKWRNSGLKGYVEGEGVVGNIGPYKNLGAASFRSIELCER